MNKSCVKQALEHLRNSSEEVLRDEWTQIESLGLPNVDADVFVEESNRKFGQDLLRKHQGKVTFLRKIVCL